MPSMLDPWAGEGSLPPELAVLVAGAEREGWAALRSLQGDPEIDVLRYEVSAGDPARGVPGGRTLVPGLSGIPARVAELRQEEGDSGAFRVERGDLHLELYTDVQLLQTDAVLFEGRRYSVMRATRDASVGLCLVHARPSPGVP